MGYDKANVNNSLSSRSIKNAAKVAIADAKRRVREAQADSWKGAISFDVVALHCS